MPTHLFETEEETAQRAARLLREAADEDAAAQSTASGSGLAQEAGRPRALLTQGILAWAARREADALTAFAQAVAVAESAADQSCAADGWHNLGIVLAATGRREEALAAFRKALEGKPDHAATYASLGREALRSGQEALAERFLRQALRLAPGDRAALRDLGLSQRRRGMLIEAVSSARMALAAGSPTVEDREALAIALTLSGDPEGPGLFASLAAEQPNEPVWRWKWSEALLLHGDCSAGWREYRNWLALGGGQVDQPRGFTEPAWRGEPLHGQTILLYAEQGLGDTLHFARYVPLVVSRGGRVVLEVQPGLQTLLARLPGITACVARAEPLGRVGLPPFAVCAPLTSLPAILATALDRVPEPLPLRGMVPSRSGDGFASMAAAANLRVGLAWAGNPRHANDRLRSMTPDAFGCLADISGVQFVSLQVEAAGAPGAPRAVAHALQLDFAERCDPAQDLLRTAEMVASLDLVITVDTAIAHLTGSLGKPVWILLGPVPDWRWGLVGERTPWYPSARLFRQTEPGGWAPVMARVHEALRSWASGLGVSAGSGSGSREGMSRIGGCATHW